MTMRLSASQLEAFMELERDRKASEHVFKIAHSFYHNQLVEYDIRNAKMWKELSEIHGIDLSAKAYTVKNINGISQIVEFEEEY